ncbi:MAG: hypothetical protein ACYC7L_03675 [Nitrospirota bacterium]
MKESSMNVKRAWRIVLVLSLLGVLSGCCGIHKPFELFDEKTTIKSGSIAVVSADSDEPTMRLADALTQELKERSTFKVLSQAEVGRRVGKYPITIKEAQPENTDKPVWFAKGEKAKVDAMHAQLRTDYIIVVWTGNLTRVTRSGQGGTSVSYHINVDGNVIEYPKGRVIGYSVFGGSKSQSCCLFGKSEGDDINEMLKDSAAEMADKFISAAKAEKPGK